MSLKYEQLHSAGWHAVKEYAAGRLIELRVRLEADISDKDTIAARAGIRELKLLLQLEQPEQPEQEIEDDEQ